jgi:transporter family-2 protein
LTAIAADAVTRGVVLRALGYSLLAGAAVSVQTHLNARLGIQLRSAELAAAVSTASALSVAVVLAVCSGAATRAWRRIRARRRVVKWWWFLVGMFGTAAMWANTAVAPVAGVVLVSVAAVCGKVVGGLVVDAVGLSPHGRTPVNVRRSFGACCVVASIVVGASVNQAGALLPVLAMVVGAGAGVAIQQAGNGHVVAVTGESLAMGALNFLVGAVVMAIGLALTGALAIADPASLPVWAGAGGVLGVAIALVGGHAVRYLGVTTLMVAQIAGQNVCAIALDVLLPLNGRTFAPAGVLGVVLAGVGVWLTYRK